jgi:hypothetical protein
MGLLRRNWRELMAGINEADAHRFAGRRRRGAHFRGGPAGRAREGYHAYEPHDADDADDVEPHADHDADEGPDEAELDAVNRLMGFLRNTDG